MNSKMPYVTAILITFLFAASLAFAQTKIDQGKPGTQGPWPVAGAPAIFNSDGGVVNGGTIATYPYHCADTSPNTKVQMDGGVITIGGSVNRLYTVVTNTGDDRGGGTAVVKCRSDGVPSLTAGTPGWVGSVGGSISYTNSKGAPIRCIGASGWVGGFECAP